MHDYPLITTLAAGFAAAWVLGLITQKLKLSPIVGYLLAGVMIGPYTPGYAGNLEIAHQLAEVGVILLMFGVGLHFHFKDLMAVKGIAVPGAVGQSLAATLTAMALFRIFEWPLTSSLVLGMAMAVASTVVLLRVLMDRDMLTSIHGHVAVGWLIVEDIFTVLVLVMVPVLATSAGIEPGATTQAAAHAVEQATSSAATAAATQQAATQQMELPGGGGMVAVVWALVKLAALVALAALAGSRIVPWILVQIAKLRSRELFTLTVLVLSITVAVLSATLFGASVALGAFLAGMVVGQSPVSHQAAADALPMRDAFAVLFFVSVGMLFDPSFLASQPMMVAAGLFIVMVIKPLAAIIIVATLGYSARTALTVAVGLGQIGEFSFILSQVVREHGLMGEDGHHVLVAVSMISISLNPLLFAAVPAIERWMQRRTWLWNLLNGRANRRMTAVNERSRQAISASERPMAVIVGYGPVGAVVDALLRDMGMETVIIDLNMDTISSLTRRGRKAIFGDASRMEILNQAGIRKAMHLVVTLPHSAQRAPLVLAARQLNPKIEITVRARYLQERETLEQAGAATIVFEEGEAGIAMARQVLMRRGMDNDKVEQLLRALRKMWSIADEPTVRDRLAAQER